MESYLFREQSICYYDGIYTRIYTLPERGDYIHRIYTEPELKDVISIYLYYGKKIIGEYTGGELIFFVDDDGDAIGIPLHEHPETILKVEIHSKIDTNFVLLCDSIDRQNVNGLNNQKFYYNCAKTNTKKCVYIDNGFLVYEKDPLPKLEHPIFKIRNQPLPDPDDIKKVVLPYIREDDNTIKIPLEGDMDCIHKLYIYLPNYIPPTLIKKTRHESPTMKKFVESICFYNDDTLCTEYYDGVLPITEYPDIYEIHTFFTTDKQMYNIPVSITYKNTANIAIKFVEKTPPINKIAILADVGYYDSEVLIPYMIGEHKYQLRYRDLYDVELCNGKIKYTKLIPGKKRYPYQN